VPLFVGAAAADLVGSIKEFVGNAHNLDSREEMAVLPALEMPLG
jgi:hypothetical protein